MKWWSRLLMHTNGDKVTPSVRSAGVAITDHALTWVVLAPNDDRYGVVAHGTRALPRGVVEGGFVRDTATLADMLRELRQSSAAIDAARVSFPARAALFFTMHIPAGIPDDQVRTMILFEMEMRVPTRSFDDAVIDYTRVEDRGNEGNELAVCVYPRELADEYAQVFREAGITLRSLEPATSALSLALAHPDDPVTMLVDVGHDAAHVSLVKKGAPIIGSVIPLAEETSSHQMHALAEEIGHRFAHWGTRRDAHGVAVTPIARIVVTGHRAGMPEYEPFVEHLTAHTGAPARYGNTWRHLFSPDDYVPPITRADSHAYTAAVGAALRELVEE